MAENKKSFIAYSDWKAMFDALPDDVAGRLIKFIFAYVNDEDPTTDDYVINALFQQIRSTLKRDLAKWDAQREQRSKAGQASAKARQRKSTGVKSRQRKPTVNVSVSGNGNVDTNVSDNNSSLQEAWQNFLEMRKKIKAKPTEKALTMLQNKLDQLAKDDEMKIEILNQSTMNNWKGLFELKNVDKKIKVESEQEFYERYPQPIKYEQ